MAKVISLNYNMGVFRGQAFREESVDGVFRGVAEVDDKEALAWFRARPDAFRVELEEAVEDKSDEDLEDDSKDESARGDSEDGSDEDDEDDSDDKAEEEEPTPTPRRRRRR